LQGGALAGSSGSGAQGGSSGSGSQGGGSLGGSQGGGQGGAGGQSAAGVMVGNSAGQDAGARVSGSVQNPVVTLGKGIEAKTPIPLPDDPCRQKADGWYKPNWQVDSYAAVWRHMVRLNASYDLFEDIRAGTYKDPVVSVTLRSDGSVDNITFNRSSGRPEIDSAVRRVVQMLAPFQPFPRELAEECDVIEFPSIWSLNRGVRLTWRGQ
jgi:TonB family protein